MLKRDCLWFCPDARHLFGSISLVMCECCAWGWRRLNVWPWWDTNCRTVWIKARLELHYTMARRPQILLNIRDVGSDTPTDCKEEFSHSTELKPVELKPSYLRRQGGRACPKRISFGAGDNAVILSSWSWQCGLLLCAISACCNTDSQASRFGWGVYELPGVHGALKQFYWTSHKATNTRALPAEEQRGIQAGCHLPAERHKG